MARWGGSPLPDDEGLPGRPDSIVMLPEKAVEFAYGWTVQFDFREHIETGDRAKAPLSSVVVDPRDGTPAHFAPTSPPPETYMMRRATGSWPPRRSQRGCHRGEPDARSGLHTGILSAG